LIIQSELSNMISTDTNMLLMLKRGHPLSTRAATILIELY